MKISRKKLWTMGNVTTVKSSSIRVFPGFTATDEQRINAPPKEGAGGSNPFWRASSEIPTTVPFPALPKTALWWEFLRFRLRLASLDSEASRAGEAETAGLGDRF